MFLHGDSIDLPTFICHHIVHIFRVLGHRISFPFTWFINHQVTSLGVTLPNGALGRNSQAIGYTTISQRDPMSLRLLSQLSLLIR